MSFGIIRNKLFRPIIMGFPYQVAYWEWFFKYKIFKQFRMYPPNESVDLYEYSRKALASFGGGRNQKHLELALDLMAALPDVDFNSLLCVGPRFTAELLVAESKGFKAEGIKALDLFSYSNRIDLGDMHSMPYEDKSFSNIIAARLLAYSNFPDTAAREYARVVRPGGYIYVSGDKTFKLVDYDKFFSECTRVFGLDGISLYSSKYPDLMANADKNCTVAIYRKNH